MLTLMFCVLLRVRLEKGNLHVDPWALIWSVACSQLLMPSFPRIASACCGR